MNHLNINQVLAIYNEVTDRRLKGFKTVKNYIDKYTQM